MKGTTAVGIIIENIVTASIFNRNRITIGTVITKKCSFIAVIGGNLSTYAAKETFFSIAAFCIFQFILIDCLKNFIVFKISS
jgi:hypothetical protein